MDDVQEAAMVEQLLRDLPHEASEEEVVQATHGFRRSAVSAAMHRIQEEASRPAGWDFNAAGDIEIRDTAGVVRVRIRRDGALELCDANSGNVTVRLDDPPRLQFRGPGGRTILLTISPDGIYLGKNFSLPDADPGSPGWLWQENGFVRISV